jgi:pyruvate/2-oxoglutarate dehydrogenase complex dihydrolipoamide acyltransferase (E2) component
VSSSPTETLVDVTMPQMGVSVAEGTVVEWKKRPGDWVEADETICEVSTDKIDTEVPSPATGRVTEVLVEVDITVDVGTVLARIATDATPGEAHADEEIAQEAPAAAQSPRAAAPRRYSPVVQRIAAEHGVDLERVEGTGRGGRVRKQDVLAFVDGNGSAESSTPEAPPLHIESPYRPEEPAPAAPPPAPAGATPPAATAPASADPLPAAPAPAGGETLSRMRRSIGAHMKRSLETAATCTTWIEVDMGCVEAARKSLGLTALPLVARCTVAALREHPQLNAWLEGETHTVHADVNLGIAVSLGEEGLIVPVIERAQELSAEGLGARIKDMAKRARTGALTPDDVRGATFTITNPGQYGSIMATPIINQPQVAILDLEAIVKRPVVVTDDNGDDAIAIRPMTILGLSWDHRALDGALAAQFLASVKRNIEGWS